MVDPPGDAPERLLGDWIEGTCGGNPMCEPECPASHIRIREERGAFAVRGEAGERCQPGLFYSDWTEIEMPVQVTHGAGEGSHDGCRLAFQQRGPFLMAWDNEQCPRDYFPTASLIGLYVHSPRPVTFWSDRVERRNRASDER